MIVRPSLKHAHGGAQWMARRTRASLSPLLSRNSAGSCQRSAIKWIEPGGRDRVYLGLDSEIGSVCAMMRDWKRLASPGKDGLARRLRCMPWE